MKPAFEVLPSLAAFTAYPRFRGFFPGRSPATKILPSPFSGISRPLMRAGFHSLPFRIVPNVSRARFMFSRVRG